MGGSESREEGAIDPNNYTQITVSAENIQRYGEIKAYVNKSTQQRIAVLKKIYQVKDQFDSNEALCRKVMALDHDSIVRLIETVSQTNEEFCSTFWTLNLHYEYVESDLKKEFQQRQQNQINYHESELWHILVSVIAALAYLKANGYEHNDVRPYSILVNEEGKVKILPKSIFGNQFNSYQEALLGNSQDNGVYLSPAQLSALSQKMTSPQHEQSKSDVYNLGLTVLECALMRNLPEAVDLQNFTINEEIIKNGLAEVHSVYGHTISEFLGEMLIPNEIQRPDVELLFSKIEQLCNQGIQVADRLFQLRDMLGSQYEQQYEGQSEQQQQFEDKNQELAHYHSEINMVGQNYPDLHEHGVEKVKRSKNASDKKATVLVEQVEIDGEDPRLEEIEHIEDCSTHAYKFSPEVEAILEEYRLKSKIQQEKIETHLKLNQRSNSQQYTVQHQQHQPVQEHQKHSVSVVQQNQYATHSQSHQHVHQQPQQHYAQVPQQAYVVSSQQQGISSASAATQNQLRSSVTQVQAHTHQQSPSGFIRKESIPAGARIITADEFHRLQQQQQQSQGISTVAQQSVRYA